MRRGERRDGATGRGGASRELERLLSVSRRGLLRAGLFGTAAVSLGGFLACGFERPADTITTPRRVSLPPAGEEILRAITPIVLGGLLPEAGSARESVLDAGLVSLDEYIAHLSSPLQREVRDLFGTLDLWPVRMLLTRSFSRWGDSSPDEVASFLRAAQRSRVFLLRRVYAFLQSLVVLSFFDQAVAWKQVGYPGPPIAAPDAKKAAQ